MRPLRRRRSLTSGRPRSGSDTYQAAGRGLGHVGHVQRHVHHHARLQPLHAGDAPQLVGDVLGCALQPREHVREPLARVVAGARRGERRHGDAHAQERADATGQHQRDRDELAAHQRHVAQRLHVERRDQPHRPPRGDHGT
jgi:hypothetical protein